ARPARPVTSMNRAASDVLPRHGGRGRKPAAIARLCRFLSATGNHPGTLALAIPRVVNKSSIIRVYAVEPAVVMKLLARTTSRHITAVHANKDRINRSCVTMVLH